MAASGEGKVMDSQLIKKDAVWGEEPGFTSGLGRQKAQQRVARDDIKEQRSVGGNVGRGSGSRTDNVGLESISLRGRGVKGLHCSPLPVPNR